MGGGGSGSDTTYSEVDQTTTNLPAYAEPYVKDMFARGAFESSQPYQEYGGQRITDFSPEEQEAFARYGEMGMSGTSPELDRAGQMAAAAGGTYATGISTTPQYKKYIAQQRENGFEAGNMYGEALDPYKDQYMQDVVDIEKREASRQGDIRNNATGLDAAGMGSLGGYREAIMRAESERNLMQQTSDIQTKGSQQAFYNAQQAFEADRNARGMQEQYSQSAFDSNENARQMATQYGLNAAEIKQAGEIANANAMNAQRQTSLNAAQTMGDFVGQRQEMEYERLGQMQQAGEARRGLEQAGLDMGYQDFITQQGWGKEQLTFLSNLVQGNSIKPGETRASYGNEPSFGQQAAGAGIAGMGLYNAMSKNGYSGG